MSKVFLRTCAALFLIPAFLVSCGPTNGTGDTKRRSGESCVPDVQGWLAEGGVDPATVDSIDVRANVRRNNDGGSQFRGWDAWVRFVDREGAIVFSMRGNCSLVSSYTRGDIALSGPGA